MSEIKYKVSAYCMRTGRLHFIPVPNDKNKFLTLTVTWNPTIHPHGYPDTGDVLAKEEILTRIYDVERAIEQIVHIEEQLEAFGNRRLERILKEFNYAVYPGKVESYYDGQIHHIPFQQLCTYYNVDVRECLNMTQPKLLKGLSKEYIEGLIALRPRADRNYRCRLCNGPKHEKHFHWRADASTIFSD